MSETVKANRRQFSMRRESSSVGGAPMLSISHVRRVLLEALEIKSLLAAELPRQ